MRGTDANPLNPRELLTPLRTEIFVLKIRTTYSTGYSTSFYFLQYPL